MSQQTIYLIDATAYFYRAFFALRGPFSTRSGFPTNAIYGYTRMINRILKQYRADYMVFVIDSPAPSFRHKMYDQYKATRPPPPGDLAKQLPFMRKISEAYNLSTLEIPGYEADDVIATIAKKAAQRNMRAVIVSGDKDYMQLVSDNIHMFDELSDRFIRREDVKEKLGVYPEQVIDYLALIGDSIDNIPGVKGIGPKTAVQLLTTFGSLEDIYNNINKVTPPRIRELLIKDKEKAFLSRELVKINPEVPLEFNFENFVIKEPQYDVLIPIFKELEFTSFLQELESAGVISQKTIVSEYQIISNEVDFEKLVQELKQSQAFSIKIEFAQDKNLPSVVFGKIVGFSFSWTEAKAAYIPVGHQYLGAPRQLQLTAVLEKLRPILEDEKIKKYGHNIKVEKILLKRQGIELKNISFDTMLAGYVLDPDGAPYPIEKLSSQYLSHTKMDYAQIAGGSKTSVENVPIDSLGKYSCETADLIYRLVPVLKKNMQEKLVDKLFYEIELPLVEVLADMEINGIEIDIKYLRKLSAELSSKLEEIQKKAWELAGERFNLDSPQQVQKILYEKLKLRPTKKTKTGYSTDVSALTKLAKKHPLPGLLLQHRSLAKFKNTYVDALPEIADPRTNRIHTSFNQAVAATGRITSSEPNLQNIPVKTDEGREIRKAFIAQSGYQLICADYSQIELRVLAEISRDENLINAFVQSRDIHTQTAAEVFGVKPSEVDSEMRRKAKAINFGIAYGLSAYGLAETLDISEDEAEKYIDNYFKRYPGIRNYISQTLQKAKDTGYVETLCGRKRYINVAAVSPILRDRAERMAINAPIQGSAADIMKMAMIKVYKRLKQEKIPARILLQVHDELVVEAPADEVERVKNILKEEMEHVIESQVPFVTEISSGENWLEAK